MKLRSLTTLLLAGVVALSLTACSKKNIRDEAAGTPGAVSGQVDEGELFAVTPSPMGEADLGGSGGAAGAAGAGGAMGGAGGMEAMGAPPEPGDALHAGIGDIFFAFDSADLSAAARETLAGNATVINRIGGNYQIEGHCDERGSAEYNLALGDRRARSTKDYLVSLGVDPSRLSTISYGEERPFAPGHDEASWAQNRRAHFLGQ
jgi:peptidoglycan-associated lipoprotein